MRFQSALLLAALFFCSAAPVRAAMDSPTALFPFTLPADDVTQGITDLSFLNARPATDPVTVKDGQFHAAGQRIRFWGVCVIGVAAFPSHQDAPLLARRLASRGINQVRIHLIDGHAAPTGIFDPAHPGELRILPAQLDKLDFFIAELKKVGIYVELPIHGYHWRNMLGETDYPSGNIKSFAPFASGLPLWSERFVEREKQFARDFFRHVNPYTGRAYTDEPAVSTVEIINENGLVSAWIGGHLRKSWPPAMRADLQRHWNTFLKTRYSTTDRLRQVWADGEKLADGKEFLRNPDFVAALASWNLQCAKPSTATLDILPAAAPAGRTCVVLGYSRDPAPLAFVNLQQGNLAIEKDCQYKVSFLAKADAPARLNVTVSMNHAPWVSVGLSTATDLTTDWQQITLPFIGGRDEADAKIMIMPAAGAGRLCLAAISLKKSDVLGLPKDESLEAFTISMPLSPADCSGHTRAFASDFVDFLYDLDSRYFDTMRDFVRNELACKQPVKGTQVDRYSSYFSQARYDYLDSHGYWQHPAFPRKPWDYADWTVANSPMVNAAGHTAVELAARRVHGKPYNISEYCHPAPSTYCAEQVPTIAAFGAFQDWDGVIFHCWQEQDYDWRRREVRKLPADRIDGWFNMSRHPVKLVTMPFGALAFRRGDVSPARGETPIPLTLAEEKQSLLTRPLVGWRASDAGTSWRDAFTHRLAIHLGSQAAPSCLPEDIRQTLSDTAELSYDLTDPASGVLTVNAPRAKAVIGFGAGKTFDLGDLILKPGLTMQNGFSVITASAVHGNDFHSYSTRILLTATGYVENQGMAWNASKTSVGNQWGNGPVMCEGIPFDLILKARSATAWPLDFHGRRLAPIPAEPIPAGLRFLFGPRYKTLWYEIQVTE